MKPKLTDDEMKAEIALNTIPYKFQHGATIEVRAIVGKNGITVTLQEPDTSEFTAIIVPLDEVQRLAEWLKIYLSKVQELKNGKKDEGRRDKNQMCVRRARPGGEAETESAKPESAS